MLVLSRKLGEQIVIGNNIRVTVVGIQGRHVKLGIEAPLAVAVYRDEIFQAREAAANGGTLVPLSDAH
jgi:carbon storage regulator